MSYQALYRVWRPTTFDELVGQKVITQTLKNSLITNQISHAYLFTGPRGTGKTSAAKIFSKAVNCPNLKDGEPCNECEICQSVNQGSLNDVIEIDAASNNGVEEIRNIRDKAKYAPSIAKYKVYIIDEVHMLSTGAFNALLKTLEEPPAHVIFILATTEPHKIPATIISRTQRFDFKRIKAVEILNRMKFILDDKKIDYEEDALKIIAKNAEGGMRDALSILDQVISYDGNNLTYESALQVTGTVTKNKLADYLKLVFEGNIKEALAINSSILDDGKDPNRFIEDLINYCQAILLFKQNPAAVNESELGLIDQNFENITKIVSNEEIYDCIEILNSIQQQMRFSDNLDVYLDIATVKLGKLKENTSVDNMGQNTEYLENQIESLKKQVSDLSHQISEKSQPIVNTETHKNDKTSVKKATVKVNLTKINDVLKEAKKADLINYKNIWDELLQSLSVTQRAIMHSSSPVAASEKGVVVSFDYGFLFQKADDDDELRIALENGLDRILNFVPQIAFVPNDDWPKIRKDYLNKNKENISNSNENSEDLNKDDDEVTKKAHDLFGDDIINVKDD
ncbi:DNA polymerase III subunit gamma/tau [Lactobacillus sp. S2-2]|uniref:DNA polymerase III subunit gamma/tau n=1 Tax=Lactobacillus sp. S2-2 TaxID=2692917 RepID=UPI001F02D6E5|nr:DNA polymerase III subunit gamma/tau [Lactobacillus sp. S2-2]MCF6515657.1 DNA polymerase III subunit gamma/tau [Lactobacillus sp. S2-2]